jgi:hypothetical protein
MTPDDLRPHFMQPSLIQPPRRPDPAPGDDLLKLLIYMASASVTLGLVWALWPWSAWMFLAALAACVVWGLR